VNRRSQPRRYVSSSYTGPTSTARRRAASRRRRTRRLLTTSFTVVLLAGVGVAAWYLIAGRGTGEADATDTASGGQPQTVALETSPSPQASASKSAATKSPSPSSEEGATFSGTHVPILMYHRIEETTVTGDNAAYFCSPKRLAQHVKALKDAGYTAVTLQQVYDYWHNGGTLPEKPVVLSFDDGTSGIADNGGPVLRKYGWPGVLSVIVPNINDSGGSLSMTPTQIRTLIDDGWELDSHSMTHPNLTTVNADRLRYELEESRRRLQEQFDQPVNFFCYPGGAHNAAVMAAAQAAGYLGATTVVRGAADPDMPYQLDRIEVDGRWVPKTLLRDLEYWQQNP